ncbi:DNA-binding transcriptional regulator, LysR family [Bacillus sp. 491mf]|uniref:LysR family transcriptional regulator n=1 Tax=Bacillus TaxID=1386 RepID=UPI0005566D33|nr:MULTISPECIES: LysR family transcriptional regulator [unclassified Bacillus (in: firmicutes)]SFD57820.1 DNA-binding transcriptional regulator, LysR family [Bacillus sp. 491mf]
MESHDLWIFKHVAELQSISRAAEKLGYVQPNISQRIKSLEEELGVKLLERNNRGVTLTEDGKILLNYTNQIMMLMDEAKSKLNPKRWRESLIIGAPQTISAVKVPRLLASFLQSNHNINVKVKTANKLQLQEMLAYGEADGIFISTPYNDSQFESAYHYFEDIVLISSNEQQQPTLLVNSDPSCIYRNKLFDFAEKQNWIQPAIMEFDSLESMLQAVHAGLGISILPADVIERTKAIHHQKLQHKMKIDFIMKRGKQRSQSLEKFILFLKEL